MFLSRIEKALRELQAGGTLPLAVDLWNGRQILLGPAPAVRIRVPSMQAISCFINSNFAKIGAAYVEGHIDIEGPVREAIRIAEQLTRYPAANRKPRRGLFRDLHTRQRDAEAIRYHYDVSNAFYALWLDRRMVYSCGYFVSGSEDIHAAQEQKLDHICRKLNLRPGDRLLDIGCGWGALLIWAAQHYGVDATGITLSQQQCQLARQNIDAAGLSDRCRVEIMDYRDIPGTGVYDRIASVGMFEHVGLDNLPGYFRIIHRLLRDGGIVMNHGITSTDPDSRLVGGGMADFIDRYVFPQGELPHLSRVVHDMGDAELEIMDVETLRLHYARTLWHWSDRLEANAAEARAIAGEKRFRIWRAYLAGCAYAFDSNWISIHQVLAVKGNDGKQPSLPLTRHYMYRN